MQETQVQSLSPEDSLEMEMTTQSSILTWEIPRIEEPGGLQSAKSWTGLSTHTHTPPTCHDSQSVVPISGRTETGVRWRSTPPRRCAHSYMSQNAVMSAPRKRVHCFVLVLFAVVCLFVHFAKGGEGVSREITLDSGKKI